MESSAATGNHINRGRLFFWQEIARGGGRRKVSTVKYGRVFGYVAVALSVPNYFVPLTAKPKEQICVATCLARGV